MLVERRLGIFIFLIIFVVLLTIDGTSGNQNENTNDSSSSSVHTANKENHYNNRQHRHHGQSKKHRSNKQNHVRVAIGHKQYVVDKNKATKPLGRSQRYVDKPDNRDKNPFLFQTYNEPGQDKYYLMPALSNGFLGTTAGNNSVYLNGLYTGHHSKSRRARLPAMTAVDAVILIEPDAEKIFQLDCRRGAYITETRTSNAIITQRYFVHRRLKNIIVNEIRVELINRQPVTINLFNSTQLTLQGYTNDLTQYNMKYPLYTLDYSYDNITFEQRTYKLPTVNGKIEMNDGINNLRANIYDPEVAGKQLKSVYIYYTNIPQTLLVYANTTVKYFHFIQSVDVDNSRALKAYEEAVRNIQTDPTSLFVSHAAAWEEIWSRSGMAMLAEPTYTENNQDAFKLAQRLYSSFYNLYSSVPISFDNQFYGVSPSGLAYGSLKSEYFNVSTVNFNRQIAEGYGGHVMYTQELWILPLLSMFNTEMAKSIINSRLRRGYNLDSPNVFDRARDAAKNENLQGLRYAWEQADFGDEVSPLQDAKKKIHTSADISFGLRTYLRTIQARDFLMQSISSEIPFKGEDYILELAKYWYDKLQLDPLTKKYGINGVSFGEMSRSKDDNNEAFTNYMAARTMDTYKYALMLTDKNPYDSQFSYITRDFDEKINQLSMPYDEFKQLYLEYDNYNDAQRNDETFVPFINFPILKKMTYKQKRILYETYARQLPNDGKNILQYASFLVGHMELNEEPKSRDFLGRMLNHFSGPFHVLSEYPQTGGIVNTNNNFNYLPGYAAFAQAFIAGYCGIRMQDFQLDVIYPSEFFTSYESATVSTNGQNTIFKPPAPNVDSWNITGLNYAGNKLDFVYDLKGKSLTITNRRPTGSSGGGEESLEVTIYEGIEVTVKPLRVDDSVKIALTTDTWKFGSKNIKQFRSALYADNLHILASISPTNKAKYLQKQSSSNSIHMRFTLVQYVFLTMIQLIILKYL